MKTNIISCGLLSISLFISSCSYDNTSFIERDGKTPVSFTTNLNTEANISAFSRAGFNESTKIAMNFIANKNNESVINATAIATAIRASGNNNSSVSFENDNIKYWDDMYGRDGNITVYAIAIPGKTEDISLVSGTQTKEWSVQATQTTETISTDDLVLSNNIKGNNALKFNNGSFDRGLLNFTHALSKITINLTAGSGFANSSFSSTPSVTLNDFNKSGTLNLEDGSYTVKSIGNIVPAKDENNTFTALVIPGTNLSSSPANISIVADNNSYTINAKTISDALRNKGVNTTLTPGMNYTLNITINKTDVNLDAFLTEWDNTEISLTPEITLTAQSFGTTTTTSFNNSFALYRSTSVDTGYDSDSNTTGVNPLATYNWSNNEFTSTPEHIYWPDHVTSYYFRALADLTGTTLPTVETSNSNDYVTISTCSGTNKSGSDICMGAPYDSDGSLIEAKNATSGKINMIFKHKLAKVFVKLTTTDGPDKVTLENATVKILNSCTSGNLNLGNAEIVNSTTPTSEYSLGSKLSTLPSINGITSGDIVYDCFVIPQSLENVQLKISTTDGNTYLVTLNNQNNISKWEEGKQYIYTLTLKKTEVTMTASYKDWETTSIDIPNVQL